MLVASLLRMAWGEEEFVKQLLAEQLEAVKNLYDVQMVHQSTDAYEGGASGILEIHTLEKYFFKFEIESDTHSYQIKGNLANSFTTTPYKIVQSPDGISILRDHHFGLTQVYSGPYYTMVDLNRKITHQQWWESPPGPVQIHRNKLWEIAYQLSCAGLFSWVDKDGTIIRTIGDPLDYIGLTVSHLDIPFDMNDYHDRCLNHGYIPVGDNPFTFFVI